MNATPPHALLRPRVALPFLAISLIWGSTWFVIRGQIDGVPAPCSLTYRFLLATPAMFALARAMRQPLGLSARAHLLALMVGLCQFAGNYNLVYLAEMHLTSGIVAVMIGLMIVPNAVLGSLVLRQPITPRFAIGSAVAIGGIALLLLNEAQGTKVGVDITLGAWLAIGAMLAASISNIIQANDTGRSVSLLALIAWAMFYGTIIDGVVAWSTVGAPVLPTAGAFWLGTAYLAITGSVVTFPLYYRLIREIGAGRAAYHNVLVIVVAMVISTLLEGYRWSALAIGGAVLALIGLVIALRAKSV